MASDKDFFRSTLAKLPMPRCRSMCMRFSALAAARFLFATIILYVEGDGGEKQVAEAVEVLAVQNRHRTPRIAEEVW